MKMIQKILPACAIILSLGGFAARADLFPGVGTNTWLNISLNNPTSPLTLGPVWTLGPVLTFGGSSLDEAGVLPPPPETFTLIGWSDLEPMTQAWNNPPWATSPSAIQLPGPGFLLPTGLGMPSFDWNNMGGVEIVSVSAPLTTLQPAGIVTPEPSAVSLGFLAVASWLGYSLLFRKRNSR